MSDIEVVNPYAPPKAEQAPNQSYSGPGFGGYLAFWQDGALAVQKEAGLPEVCLKCARTDNLVSRREKFVWNPKWVYFFLLCNLIICAIIMAFVQKKGALTVPICSDCQAQWKKGSWAWGLGLIGTFTLPFVIGGLFSSAAAGFAIFILGLIGSVVVNLTMLRPRSVWAQKIDDTMIFLGGVHPGAAEVILNRKNG